MKIIRINDCSECPHRQIVRGSWQHITDIPSCQKTKSPQVLPYILGSGPHDFNVAKPLNDIPSWCPLESGDPVQMISKRGRKIP